MPFLLFFFCSALFFILFSQCFNCAKMFYFHNSITIYQGVDFPPPVIVSILHTVDRCRLAPVSRSTHEHRQEAMLCNAVDHHQQKHVFTKMYICLSVHYILHIYICPQISIFNGKQFSSVPPDCIDKKGNFTSQMLVYRCFYL